MSEKEAQRQVQVSKGAIRAAVEAEGEDIPQRFDLAEIEETAEAGVFEVTFIDGARLAEQHLEEL